MKALLESIGNEWFFTEPLLFASLFTHQLVANNSLEGEMRSGNGCIEYNEKLLSNKSRSYINRRLAIEVARILLRHPYQRQPLDASPICLALASDVTIAEYYDALEGMATRSMFELPPKLSFEEYYALISILLQQDSDKKSSQSIEETPSIEGAGETQRASQSHGEETPSNSLKKTGNISQELRDLIEQNRSKLQEQIALWHEDNYHSDQQESLIEQARARNDWGSFTRGFCKQLLPNPTAFVNIRSELALFRAHILSTQVALTRMKPSRRYGFAQMGIRHPYTTRLLVAVDVSGSISETEIAQALGVINHFFLQGIERIDLLQFDNEVHPPVLELRRAQRNIEVKARGGTTFQPVIDYFQEHKQYDGLIIITDGLAPLPRITTTRRILWILNSVERYRSFGGTPKLYIKS